MTLSPHLLRRIHWLNLPGALLLMLLQRTPVLRVAVAGSEMVAASPLGAVLRSAAMAAASLGAMHTLAGATAFVTSANPANGTVGNSMSVSFAVTGATGDPGSYDYTGDLPPGIELIGANSQGVLNASSGTFSGVPTAPGTYTVSIMAYQFANRSGDTVGPNDLTFVITGTASNNPPLVSTNPTNKSASPGDPASFTVTASGATSFQWQRNGVAVAGGTSATLNLSNVQPANTGLYTAVVTNSNGSTLSQAAILGLTITDKVFGTGEVVGSNIPHQNGRIFDQVQLNGTGAVVAATVTADAGQTTRTSFIDLNNDIVQVEFVGAGTVSLVLTGSSGPAAPTNYNQPNALYMKGHAGIVVTGANETTNLSVFTVGRATAFDPTYTPDTALTSYDFLQGPTPTNLPANNKSGLFTNHPIENYDAVADIAFVAIATTNGKFGGLRTANARYWADAGLTGVYAPGVEFNGPVFVGDITAMGDAMPCLQVGSVIPTNFQDGDPVRITGGDLQQDNGRAVQVSGFTQLFFRAGTNSQGVTLTAKNNQAVLEENGVNVTSQIVVNP